ncbi:TPA: hypothetical protein NKQ43_002600 [Vibrio parahaemolyticus]|uniref:hypothetical protein n=1 Tax=Vibrio parahaemolyticus TaxID=670 RepID=UPI00079FFE9B|nr:hypothetical protein [Vibrio parahaemolyticus]KYY56085.1 hypothetical protein AWQ14_20700 [Vibrio parahaemolyticus]OKY50145.1 hypothetical protein BUL36_12015 [Vibrio parahaemolyticus]HCE2582320.1 hypothetical protein [Vibrio parahaemolyticus]HCE2728004.1 hypothetical protein [Vibrio parahaemolyticus]HCE2810873.1 hypothetical protein [Vibrio parahaemolyticus]
MFEKIKALFKNDIKYDPKNITIVTGVEQFLTDTARTHKRNLLYTTFILASIIWLIGNKKVNSAFGFNVEGGIDTKDIISVIAVVVIYELFMLWFYYKDCKCQWFGMSIGQKGELPKFKENIEQIKVNLECKFTVPDIERYTIAGSGIADIIDYEKKYLDNLVDEWKKQNVVSTYHEMTNHIDNFIQIYKDIYELAFKDANENNFNRLLGAEINLSRAAVTLKRNADDFQRITRPYEGRDKLLNKFSFNFESTKVQLAKIKQTLTKLETATDNLSRQLFSLQRGYMRYKRVDFILPTVFSIVVLASAICQIFDISALDYLEKIFQFLTLKFLQLINSFNAV